jgi:hypothetical protein
VGQESSVNNEVVLFSGTTGKVIKGSSGKLLPTGSIVGTTDTQDLTNKSIIDLEVKQSGTGESATIDATGVDSNVELNINAKGDGWINTDSNFQVLNTVHVSRVHQSNWGATLNFNKRGNASDEFGAVANHGEMGNFQVWGYDGTDWGQGGVFGIWADEAWDTDGHGTRWVFQHVEVGTTDSYRVFLQSDAEGVKFYNDRMRLTEALLLPRLTTAERDGISATNGMIIYNSTTDKFQGRANGSWVDLH